MKTISIHGIDKEAERAILERAKSSGRSVNKVMKELIADSLGLGAGRTKDRRREAFADLCGAWSAEEAARFLERVSDLETVDDRDWR